MPNATTRSEAAASNPSPQTLNLADRTAPRRQRANSAQSSDSDPTSSSGSSSEDDSESEREDEEHSDQEMNGTTESTTHAHASDPSSSLPHIAGRPKPRIHRIKGDSGLLSRLNAFLPKMKDANEDLKRQIEAGEAGDLVLDNADENGEQYIEMDLGLGVLEEKRDDDSSSDEESDDEGSEGATGPGKAPQEMNDSDIIGKLMGGKGKKSNTDKPSIEEMA
ncbi:Uncharacterized protein C12orf45-like protein [Penicillium chrysogenum]|uniref:Pc12g15050 protein n=2 Tax=Penicillium chrysogenum species complex TaxID=254878 RepID=B6GX74_PENRW|nr:uncharacterized protein N7525_001109 [Penicillium rubens]KZN91637.1 Uncharacterized protein C12orf45-like protein [Penicillium chrysogenum]CAP81132.1 Pc12g15050 [Penicillium rubens Wisconsin 54-1255]KAJ5039202.1 hypothetical protein NUH16_008983 [Penicillium rubens]KAJ5843368.1 hypothetical protein N7525_001109 [Penicillium rubens]KAJ5846047.1 hypothetical protein N7534_009716 [Penicillium rubens]